MAVATTLRRPETKIPEIPPIITPEEALKATSWWQGFLDGRKEGYRVGLQLGMGMALQLLEGMVKKTDQGKTEEQIGF